MEGALLPLSTTEKRRRTLIKECSLMWLSLGLVMLELVQDLGVRLLIVPLEQVLLLFLSPALTWLRH